MKIIALEDHFVAPDVIRAWNKLDPGFARYRGVEVAKDPHASVIELTYLLDCPSVERDREKLSVAKSGVRWAETKEGEDYKAAVAYLSLLCSDRKASALAKSLRSSKPIEHAAKDLLRSAQLPLLPRDDPHVDEDLKRIQKGKPLAPVLVIRGDMAKGLPLTVADGYHRICAVVYFDESAPVRCRIANLTDGKP